MVNVLTRKLEVFGPLPDDDRRLLDDLVKQSRLVQEGVSFIEEGDEPANVHLILEGFACRHKILANGARQIFAYLIPGDLCDLNVFILKQMDHNLATLTPCRIVDIPRALILDLMRRPAIARAIWWATLVDEATLREWLVNLGQRSAEHRIAHLFCELHLRFESIGLASGGEFELPLTQAELGDTMGISVVHVNRSLKTLKDRNLVQFKSGHVVIPDVRRLWEVSGFNPNYLHLDGGKRDDDDPGALH